MPASSKRLKPKYLLYVGIHGDEPKLLDERDVALEREQVRAHSRCVIVIMLGEHPIEASGAAAWLRGS